MSAQIAPGPRAAVAIVAYFILITDFGQTSLWAADSHPYPQTSPSIHDRTYYPEGDLSGPVDANRPLSLEDLNVLLKLSQIAICKEADQRSFAINDLGRLGHSYAIPALLAVIRDEHDPYGPQMEAVLALSAVPAKRVVDYLIDLLTDERSGMAHQARWRLEAIIVAAPTRIRALPLESKSQQRKTQAAWRKWWRRHKQQLTLRHKRGVRFTLDWRSSAPLSEAPK